MNLLLRTIMTANLVYAMLLEAWLLRVLLSALENKEDNMLLDDNLIPVRAETQVPTKMFLSILGILVAVLWFEDLCIPINYFWHGPSNQRRKWKAATKGKSMTTILRYCYGDKFGPEKFSA